MPATALAIAPEPFGDPGPQSIVLAARDEFDRLYGRGGRGAHDLHDGDFDPPRGVYLVARVDGHLAGGVGLRGILEPGARTGEVKRLWVRPDLRRGGVARTLMASLLEAARGLGYVELYLETGPKQPGARRLYQALGWEEVAAFPAGAHVHDTGTRFHLVL
jgi:GNAT superfamily N-acetyltransferase